MLMHKMFHIAICEDRLEELLDVKSADEMIALGKAVEWNWQR